MGRNRTNSVSHRESAAYTATKCNDPKSIELLRDFWREEGVFPIDNRGDTILHFIAIHGNVSALKLLIEERPVSGQDLKIQNKDGNTALHEAARFGQLKIVKVMVSLDSEILFERNSKGETPIYVAAAHGEKEVFAFLADNNMCDEFTMTRNDGSTVLHAAVTHECYCNAWLGVMDDEKQKHILALTLARILIKEEDWNFYANNCVENPLIQATKLASVGSPFKFSTEEPPIEKTTRGYKTLILMAWGVLWFKRVKYCVHPRLWTMKDDKNMTPKELFDQNHSNVCIEAEKAIKDLANPALILSTLLCTINFAAVFTIPGGFDDKSGLPILLSKPQYSELWMLMFFIGAALYDSVFTMGTVLSVLLSKFDSDDFYIALPIKYCTVIISVYYSTAFTVLGCVQALNVENIFMDKDVWWLVFLLMCLGWYMGLIVLDVCYIVFDYVYYLLNYSFLFKGNKHVM
ncbi:hypothetical protein H5410_058680 [Solanum commersonii]|uniref:PGG domain-containing protein n=1 Tax=Solanum commersonii TaxID=4109 RepID=A0A9J5WS93_SOLCO|nr:hypothetical protein H5410_058680 [Solanum commersonii]